MRIAMIVVAASLLAASLSFATQFSTADMPPMNEIAEQQGRPVLSGAPAPDVEKFVTTKPLVLVVNMWMDSGILVRGPEGGTLKVLVTEGLRVIQVDGKLTVKPGSTKSGLVAAVYTTPDGGVWAYAFRVSFWID